MSAWGRTTDSLVHLETFHQLTKKPSSLNQSHYNNQVESPNMDHTHFKDQKSCQICVENQKDVLANMAFRVMRTAVMREELRIQLALLTMFTPHKLKPKSSPSKKDDNRTRTNRKT